MRPGPMRTLWQVSANGLLGLGSCKDAPGLESFSNEPCYQLAAGGLWRSPGGLGRQISHGPDLWRVTSPEGGRVSRIVAAEVPRRACRGNGPTRRDPVHRADVLSGDGRWYRHRTRGDLDLDDLAPDVLQQDGSRPLASAFAGTRGSTAVGSPRVAGVAALAGNGRPARCGAGHRQGRVIDSTPRRHGVVAGQLRLTFSSDL
jgi:hypothetical protein